MYRVLVILSIFLLLPSQAAAQLGGGGAGGIYIDPEGVLRELPRRTSAKRGTSDEVEESSTPSSEARHVSLKRLDQALRPLLESQQPIPREIDLLAGLVRIDAILIDRSTKDILLVGPAEGWIVKDGRIVGEETGRPLLQLADLTNALRCVLDGSGIARCSIDPTREGLAALKEKSFPTDINTKTASNFRKEVEETYGLQTVRTGGVPEGSRFALTMIEADYRMKRMAIGKEKVKGVVSHLDALAQLTREDAHRGTLARWWFAPAYDEIRADEAKSSFRFVGQGVKLLNEEVLFNAEGERSGLGRSNPDWDRFSDSFTAKFPELEKEYAVFADLRNLFDLMMVAGLVRQQGIEDWLRGTAFLDSSLYLTPTWAPPTHAEPVVMTRIHRGRRDGKSVRFLTIAYGGVTIDPMTVLSGESIAAALEVLAAGDDAEVAAETDESESPFANIPDTKTWWADAK